MKQGRVGARADDTIVALSSGRPPAGVAVVRISGPKAAEILARLVGPLPEPRRVVFRAVRDPSDGALIDRGLVFHMAGPGTFTGEDVAELQLHGSRAVVAAVLRVVTGQEGCRLAEAGEFTERAFRNGRLDLTAAEGLADLIAAETEAQRVQALAQSDGRLFRAARDWRDRLLDARALVEAQIDFSDEEDTASAGSVALDAALDRVGSEMASALRDSARGERVRDGYKVALMGRPNAGKSSLINALAERDVAIVSDLPGTTRDLLEVHLDLGGEAVILTDTAGLRDGGDAIEAEGIRRAMARAAASDLILWLDEDGGGPPPDVAGLGRPLLVLATKSDLRRPRSGRSIPVSTVEPDGLAPLLAALQVRVAEATRGEPALVTQARQKAAIAAALKAVEDARRTGLPLEIRAEHLRRASDQLGRLVGRTDVEAVLGSIFARFCIGK